MSPAALPAFRPSRAVPLSNVPIVPVAEFRRRLLEGTASGQRVIAFYGRPGTGAGVRLTAVLARDTVGELRALSAEVDAAFPALTPDDAQFHWFEREIAEQWGVRPEGHPWLKPLRFHPSYRPGRDAWSRRADAPIVPSVTAFHQIEGEETHEVAVGPVHAGIIEPGHFRFQCHGEEVFHLEISLGYQHRGVERRLAGGPDARTLPIIETLAGDTTIGHALAHCEAVEALAACRVPARAQAIRAIALELERLANHTGDLGALAGDVGYLPTQSFCGRIRGDFLNMTALLCGNRFGRGLVRPGGVAWDLEVERVADLRARLERAERDVTVAVDLLWATPSVMARFEETGALSMATGLDLGLVGPAARACGIGRDLRQDFPSGLYRFVQVPVSTATTGDVFARAMVRWLEIQRSLGFLRDLLDALPAGPIRATMPPLAADAMAVGLVEGWRGEICHIATTDAAGRFARYKVVDPSFHNWMGLAMALRDQPISDFPLCNKSFNLSYCGHDL